MEAHRIVIVGGGAGGLPLATQLGHSLGRRSCVDQWALLHTSLQAIADH